MSDVAQQRYNKGYAITLSDTVNFPFIDGIGRQPDAIIANTTAGIAVCVGEDGLTFNVSLALGIPQPVKCKRVNSTSTTAAGLVALYII